MKPSGNPMIAPATVSVSTIPTVISNSPIITPIKRPVILRIQPTSQNGQSSGSRNQGLAQCEADTNCLPAYSATSLWHYRLQPTSSSLTRARTESHIASVNFPVCVFCRLTW